jgi:hypothetical protein
VKFSPIQQDFSMGELSQRLWGQVASDAYKAGLARAANFLPTQQGSIASRAGGQLVNDGKFTPGPAGVGAVLLPIQDGPAGDFQVECRVGSTLVRFLDKYGAIPVKLTQDLTPFFENNKDGNDVWTDPVERKLYIRNYDVAVGTPNRAITLAADVVQLLNGALGTCQISFYYAGTGLVFEQWNGGAMFQVFAVSPGYNAFTFDPANGITLKFSTVLGYGLAAIDIWGMHLACNQGGGPFYTLNVPGLVVSTGLKHTAFWSTTTAGKQSVTDNTVLASAASRKSQPVFVIIITGPGMLPVALTWTGKPSAGGAGSIIGWGVPTVKYEGIFPDPDNDNKTVFSPPWLTAGAVTALIAYQGRVWFGINDAYGSLHASKVGYGVILELNDPLYGAVCPAFRLTFSSGSTTNIVDSFAGQVNFDFFTKTSADDVIRVFKNGLELTKTTDYTVTLNADQVVNPGGRITLVVGAVIHDKVVVWHGLSPAPAGDALDLKIAQPTGGIAWLAELRGLILGTTHNERVFSSGALAIDPVSGSAFDVEKHTSFGSQLGLPALELHDKIVFALGGRQRIRVMGKNFNTFGGLLASDLSMFGEHLLKAKIRSMCHLRSPVPRLVFAFDDGTGAIATFNDDKNTLAWARFTMGAPYDVFHVSSLDVPGGGSELWVTSSCGAIFVIRELDSAVVPRTRKVVPVVATNQADQIVTYAAERTPPIMDGWLLVPVRNGVTVYAGLPVAWVGKNVEVIDRDGNLLGIFAAITDGAGGAQVTLAAPIAVASADRALALQANFLTLGIDYPEHKFKLLPLEGGEPQRTAQGNVSRRVQGYLRLVDSYLPLADGVRVKDDRDPADPMDLLASRVTGDRRITEMGFTRGAQLEISMDKPLRVEVSAIFGPAASNSI